MLSGPSSNVLSPAQTLVDGRVPPKYSTFRRYFLLLIYCCAQFLDAVNNCALYSAIPSLVISLNISESQSTWIISAFQLTFASFLLISGRVSDVYSPKLVFTAGIAALGAISIGAGFVHDKITLIILRALPTEQARAIGIFGGCGAVGNVLGLIIGAIFVEFASWHWVFWFVALVAFPIAGISLLLVPSPERRLNVEPKAAKWKSLDIGGVSILTVALILFIFSITSGSTDGWASAAVLSPLIISVVMIVTFFYYETRIPFSRAAVPPRTWFLPNFSVLFVTALLPYFWWTTIFMTYTTLWQDVYHWSVISTAIHMIPIGVLSFVMSFSGPLSSVINSKWIIACGEFLLVVATILLAFADGPDKYWRFVFPGFVLGSGGAMLTFTHTNIAIFQTCPPSFSGTVGAIFNAALQLGSAIGIAAVGSIQTSVQAKHGGPDSYSGAQAAFWFLLGIVCVELVSMLIFYHTKTRRVDVLPEKIQEDTKGELDFHDKAVDNKLAVADTEEPANEVEVLNVDELAISPV
ncbi:Cephamycin export protein [Sparassis crispa]|uniref:Cephamycin export protein n=1 Tax=Sparassis crispa TaxID=139825 RepID=A0A401GTY9_9APHY|nr:Cephamycin export protein [Sparassis crispa]GBE85688.1 Cephamycin export protein [Sparassis crispa]